MDTVHADNKPSTNNTVDNESLYTLKLPVSKEYEPMIQDVVRLSIIQLTMFLMYYMSSSPGVTFSSYLVMQLFLIIGVSMYWLVFKKIVKLQLNETP